MTLEQKALAFATAAHAAVGQIRKYTGEPYIVHPIEVAEIVRTVPHTEEMIAAALLHDVVEDTKITIDVIKEQFGDTVAFYVDRLTDTPKVEGGPNRKARKALDRARLAASPAEVQTIKLADFISNTFSIVEHDPNFAKVYLEEKRQALDLLNKGNEELHHRASSISFG